jgi:hypothetical protein
MRRPLFVRTVGKRAGRPTRPRVRVTKPARKLSGAERAAVEERLRNDGIRPPAQTKGPDNAMGK